MTPNITKDEAQRLLADSRAKIDSLDRKIVDLLNERTRIVADIGRAKTALGTPVLELRREENVFRNVMLHNHGPIPNEALKHVFEQIMKEMRALQGMAREPELKQHSEGTAGNSPDAK